MEADKPPDTPRDLTTASATAHSPARQTSLWKTDQPVWKRLRSQFNPRPIQDDKPRDWWFASTAIPLIAAATAPFANVMSIVALAIPWRSTIHYDKTGNDGLPLQVPYDDPTWSVRLNATSLACGVIGNIFLLCNFTQAVRYIIALPVSIVLWWMATAILIEIIAAVDIYAPPTHSHQLYTTAFYFAIIAACLYFFNLLILTINLVGYLLGHYPQHFALSNSQRTLILQTTAFSIWLIVGAAIFQKLIGISFSDALYFSDITVLTLGFGDILAITPVARGIIFPYAVLGIVMLGLIIGSVNQFFSEIENDNVVRKRMDRKRQALVETSPTLENDYTRGQNGANIRQEAPESASGSNSKKSFTNESATLFSHSAFCQRRKQVTSEEGRFHAMRAIQNEVASFRRWFSLIQCLISFAIVWTIGALVFSTLQPELTYFDALYFNFVCLLSIGYGDITPNTNSTRAFFVLWSLIAVPTMTTLISVMSDTVISAFQRATNMLAGWSNLSKSPLKQSRFMRIPLILKLGWTREARQNSDSNEPVDDDEEHVNTVSWSQSERPFPSSTERDIEGRPSDMEVLGKLTYAIKRVIRDTLDGGNQYSYEEWAEFIQLIQLSHPCLGELNTDKDEYGRLHWDWISESTPMMSKQSEPEWILDRLCESIIRCNSMHGKRCSPRNEEKTGSKHEDDSTKKANIDFQEGSDIRG